MTSLLAFIFFFSGFASLMYQIAWQRLLTVHYGVGAVSITLIVSVYMFGLGVGALIGGALAERVRDKMTLYFVVQLLLGAFGLISLPFLDFLGRHTAGASHTVSLWYMAAFLSLPTILMGITLPLLTKIFNGLINDFLSTVGYLYFVNTIGATVGTLFAGYILISFFGLRATVYCAAAVDLVLAAFILSARFISLQPHGQQASGDSVDHRPDTGGRLGRIAYPLVFITGFLALGYEIIWFRFIGVLVKASPYVFSSVLAVYLLGIGLGSYAMVRLLQRPAVSGKPNLFFMLQFLIGTYVLIVFLAYYYLTLYTPLEIFSRTSFNAVLHPTFIIPSFQSVRQFLHDCYVLVDVFLWPLVFVLIPTILMGASFPLIAFLSQSDGKQEGKTVGTIYFFNIGGAVLGGLLTGFLLLPIMGTGWTVLAFSSIGVLFGLFVTQGAGREVPLKHRIAVAGTLLVLGVAAFPTGERLYGAIHEAPGESYQRFIEEGRDGVVVTYQRQDSIYNYINGLGHGGRPVPGFYYEGIEGLSFARQVESVLIIGFGTGSVTEMILRMEGVKQVTIVELNPTLIKNLEKMQLFRDILADDRIELIIDDGRRFLLRTDEEFDLIQIDALRATTSYSNNIYSRQFFELARQRLSDGGVFITWMDEYRVIPKTLASVFEHVRLYDFFALASRVPFVRKDEVRRELLAGFPEGERQTIATVGRYVGDQHYIEAVTVGYDINEDWKPVTEYYLGLRIEESFRPW